MHGRTASAAAALTAFAVLGLAACGGETAGDGLQLVPGERSEAAFPDAAVEITAPAEGSVVDTTSPAVRLSVQGFELGAPTPGAEQRGLARSENGQHVHLILDNRPYQAVYDTAGPIQLADAPLDPGIHVLRAFASRQWHESVKSSGSYAITHFFVGDTTAEGVNTQVPYGPDGPILTYSRPKGTYEGAGADSVMVDFFLTGAELGPQSHKVRVTVDDTASWTIERWSPHYLVGLSDGEHQVRLELLDPDLQPVPGTYNTTERTISVVRDPTGGAATGAGGESGY